jgi:hypothetical protein
MMGCAICGQPATKRNRFGICNECMQPVIYDESGGRITSVFDRENEREPDDDELLPPNWSTP